LNTERVSQKTDDWRGQRVSRCRWSAA